MIYQSTKRKDVGLFYINWDKYIKFEMTTPNREIFLANFYNINDLPNISNNQEKILTNIMERFDKLNFFNKIKNN